MKRFLITFAFGLLAASASAQTSISFGGFQPDTEAAIEITADALSLDQDTGRAEFSGNVDVTQGANKITAAFIAVTYDEDSGQIVLLEATGGVTFVTATDAAESETAVYDLRNDTLRMSGGVLLTQGVSAIGADSMVVDLKTGAAQLDGRVRTTLVQQSGQ